MEPPFTITKKINLYISEISRYLGKYEAIFEPLPNVQLRKKNRIKTIKSTLAIEGNTLTEEQITAILSGKKVLGKPKEILEVKNSVSLYENLNKFKPYSIRSFKSAHKILMQDLIKNAGLFRTTNVGIWQGSKVKHVAPKAIMVPELVEKLFIWAKKTQDLSPLIKSCVVHYELEFIHPFEDGNGRMGRFWQTVILSEFEEIFRYLPIESLIEKNQKEYYNVLEICDKNGESTQFVEFILRVILESLSEFLAPIKTVKIDQDKRLTKASEYFGKKEFSKKEYLEFLKSISSATASRDLYDGVSKKYLCAIGQKNQTKYKFEKIFLTTKK